MKMNIQNASAGAISLHDLFVQGNKIISSLPQPLTCITMYSVLSVLTTTQPTMNNIAWEMAFFSIIY